MKPPGILVSCFDFSPVAEDEFHDWYDTEHIPERERVPGFRRCRRWLAVDREQVSAATYDLESVDVLRSPEYLAIGYQNNSPWTKRVGWRCVSLLRFEGELVAGSESPGGGDAGYLLVCAMDVEPAREDEVAARFRDEHVPAAAAVPAIHDARLFRATASARTHVVLYRLHARPVDAGGWKPFVQQQWVSSTLAAAREPLTLLFQRYVREAAQKTRKIA